MQSRLFAHAVVTALAACIVVFGTGSTAVAADVCAAPQPAKVPAFGTVVGTGAADTCTESALRAALAAGGHVTFRCGAAGATIAVAHEISVTKTTVIDGAGKVTLDGGGKNRILVAQGGVQLSVRNLRFVNGAAAQSGDRGVGSGGAIAGGFRSHVEVIGSTFENNSAGLGGGAVAVAADSTLSIIRSVFTGNSGWWGGAVYSLLSPLTVVDSTFTGNRATSGDAVGGAIGTDGASGDGNSSRVGKGGMLRICGSVIRHNKAKNGGGAFLWTYAPDRILIERTTFEANEADGQAGGARISVGTNANNKTGTITVTASSILSNTSGGNGGGFYLDCAPTCTINNTTFHGNTTKTYGGAIFGDGHHDNNVTFAKNSAGGHGGALFGGKFVLNNTVFVGNTARNPWGQAMSCSQPGTGAHVLQWGGTSRDGSTACIPGVLAKDPQLAAPADNGGPTLTMMPAAGSQALNAGAGCESRDQRGTARGTTVCDLGAVQRTPFTSPSAGPGPSAAPSGAASASVRAADAASSQAVDGAGPIGLTSGRGALPFALAGTGVVAAAGVVAVWAARRRGGNGRLRRRLGRGAPPSAELPPRQGGSGGARTL
jgi:predicted outer membrane repeat protein